MKLLPLVAALALAGCASQPEYPGKIYTQVARTEKCKPTSEKKIAALFERWNDSLQTGDPHKVVANYADDAILLATVSKQPRLTPAEREGYFEHFLLNEPAGKIDLRRIYLGCNVAVDAGLYTFIRLSSAGPARWCLRVMPLLIGGA